MQVTAAWNNKLFEEPRQTCNETVSSGLATIILQAGHIDQVVNRAMTFSNL